MFNLKLFTKKKQLLTDYYSATLFTDQLKEYYTKATIEPGVAIRNPGYVEIDEGAVIGAFSSIVAINEHQGHKYTPFMKIGRGTSIGFHAAIGVSNKILIGENVTIAGYVQINDTNHCYEDITKPIGQAVGQN
jgi:acetyltransferase-like isoleucine patch superfamily enzyme